MATQNQLRTPVLIGYDIDEKRQQIAEYFNQTFEQYESLFETLVN